MSTQPDRFERAVNKVQTQYDTTDGEGLCPMIDREDAVTLLRREHNAVRRLVATYRKNMWANGRNAVNEGRLQACDDILAALDTRRR